MLFRFAATLPFAEIFNVRLVVGYLLGTTAVYVLATLVAWIRGLDIPTAAVEANARPSEMSVFWACQCWQCFCLKQPLVR